MEVIAKYGYNWVYKWSLYLKTFAESLRLGLEAIYLSLYKQRQGFKSILEVVSAQVYFTGVQALPMVMILASIFGALVVFQTKIQMSFFADLTMPGKMFVMVIFRELSCLIPALILIARSGSAISSELSSMVVNREVISMRTIGIHPSIYIVFPRLLGGIVSLLGLCIYFNLAALFAGYIVANISMQMDLFYYLYIIFEQINISDIFIFLLKAVLSGFIIFSVCCYAGLNVKLSSHEIPQATMSAVMTSFILVFIVHITLTLTFYFIKFYSVLI